MPALPVSDKVLQQTVLAYSKYKLPSPTARFLGISESTLRRRILLARDRGFLDNLERPQKREEFSFTPIPDDDIPIEDLIHQRKKQFQAKRQHEEARKLIAVNINIPGPIGILHFGDPHVDDDGTDIEALERHSDLCRNVEGLFAANVGDTTNNWTGRLAKLYADQSTSAKQAWKIAEWFVTRNRWLYMLAGNHDAWSGEGDPLKWISRQTQALYQSTEARLSLNFPNGAKVRINARHDFSGHSQWNPAHGPMKSVFHGVRDHIAVCGHRHKSGYGIIKDPESGIACHAIQVASYKIYDRYARDKGFRDQSLSPCVLTVIDPSIATDHPDMVKVFWSPEEGAEYLTWKRSRVGSAAKKSR